MSEARSAGATLGRVGRPHGLDGSFYLESPEGDLAEGAVVAVAGREAIVERRAGTAARTIEVDRRFLGLDADAEGGSAA